VFLPRVPGVGEVRADESHWRPR